MNVTVRNNQDSLTIDTIDLETTLPDGTSANILQDFPGISLARNEEIVFHLGVRSEALRAQLLDGYTVTVNPYNRIVETDYDNNSYSVPGQTVLQLYWCGRFIPHLGGMFESSGASMDFSARVLSGSSSRLVMERSWSNEVTGVRMIDANTRTSEEDHYAHTTVQMGGCDDPGEPFTIMGDEWLRVDLIAAYRVGRRGDFGSIGSSSLLFPPNERWGAGRISEGSSIYDGGCWTDCRNSGGSHYTSVSFSGDGSGSGSLSMHTWHSYFMVCEVFP